MAIWVNNVTGNDANTGANPTDSPPGTGPKLTWNNALSAITVGQSMNVMNTGTPYDIGVTTNIAGGAALAGSDFVTNFGCRIQGVTNDATGNPSLVTIRHAFAGSSLIGVREGQNYIVIQGFKIDRPNGVASNTNTFVNINDGGAGNAGPGLVQYCWDISTSTRSGAFVREVAGSGNAAAWQIQYNFIQNPQTNSGCSFTSSPNHQTIINNCVWELGLASSGYMLNFGTNDSTAGVDHQAHHNTIVCRAGRVSFANSSSTFATGASASAQKHFHSNLFVQFTADAGSDKMFTGSATWEDQAWAGTRDIGWNVFVDAGGFSWDTGHPYTVPWDPDSPPGDSPENTQYWATDVQDTAASADPFNDSGTAWDWNPNSSGYTIPLPGDYRLTQYRTSDKTGGAVGAIADNIAELDGDTSLTIYANVGQPVTDAIQISNIGGGTLNFSSITFVSSDPSLVYNGPASDSLTASETVTYTFTFTPTTHPTSVTATLTIVNDDADENPFVVSIEAHSTATWTPGHGPIGEDNPGFFIPPASGVTASIELRKNLEFYARLAAEIGDSTDIAISMVNGVCHLVTNSGIIAVPGLTITGLNKLMVVPHGGNINLTVGGCTLTVRDGGCFVIANTSNLSTVLLENTSTIREVEVHFFGSKGS